MLPPSASAFATVLGVAQDGGHPQPGCRLPCCAGDARHLPACLGLVDAVSHRRFLLDATPALPEQLARFDRVFPTDHLLDGILLTHAHVGHYTGLLHLGREIASTRAIAVWALPRMAAFLAEHAPWSQLVALGNIHLHVAEPDVEIQLGHQLFAAPILVPHRDEWSETVGWRIRGPERSLLWLPDIDRWDTWDRRLADELSAVDAAWVDGTFWDDGELARDMAEIPHPRVTTTLRLVAGLPDAERAKLRFVHLNHTNPLLDPASPQGAAVRAAGCQVAFEGEQFGLRAAASARDFGRPGGPPA